MSGWSISRIFFFVFKERLGVDSLEVLRWLRERLELLPAGVGRAPDRHIYLSQLLDMRLPLPDFPVADLVALRREGAFERWRSRLAEAVLKVSLLGDEEFLDPSTGRIAILRERMEAAAEENHSRHKKRRSPYRRRSGIVRYRLHGGSNRRYRRGPWLELPLSAEPLL